MITMRSVKFTTKLFVGILAILALSLTIVIAVTTMQVRKELFALGRDAMENISLSVYNSIPSSRRNSPAT